MSSTILSDVIYDLNNRYPNLNKLPKGRFLGVNESNYMTKDGDIITIFISDDEKHTLVLSETLSLIIYNGNVKHWFSSLSKELTEHLALFNITQSYVFGESTTWTSEVNGNKITRTINDITYYTNEHTLRYDIVTRTITVTNDVSKDNVYTHSLNSTANWRVELLNALDRFLTIHN